MKYIASFFVFGILTLSQMFCFADNCTFAGGNPKLEFKNCVPSIGIQTKSSVNLDVSKPKSDFRIFTGTIVRRIQIVTSIIAIGVLVWIGLIMVLPVSAEAKESAKSKILSVLFGFLIMLAATIIVNGIINIIYEILK